MHTDTEPSAGTPPDLAAPHPWRWRILALVLLAEVMDLLDSTVMNVAAPVVRDGLGGGDATLQWLTAGYTLAFGVLLVVGGRLGDRWGRRRLFVLGAAGFAVASGVSALAPTPTVLLAARVAQGGFGALLIPQGFGVLTEVFTDRERGRAFGLFGPVLGLSAVGGPVLAGALIGLGGPDLGWRLIFLINVPIGVVAVLGARRWMPRDAGDPTARLDPWGALLVALGSALLVHPLIQGREDGWPWWTAAEIVAAVLAFAALARRQRTATSPILVPSLLRNRTFLAGLATAVGFFAGIGGLILVLALYLQLALRDTPLQAGLTMAPLAAGIAASSLVAARLTRRLGRGVLHLGLGVEGGGALLLAAITLGGAPAPVFGLAAGVIGLGMGLMFGPLIQTILAGAAPHEVGSASGVLGAVQQIATALGVAVLGTLFFTLDAGPTGLAAGALAVVGVGVGCAALVLRLPRSLSTTPGTTPGTTPESEIS